MELDELRRLSAKNELSLNYIAKDEKISELLLFLQGKENTVLKGGTAINRLYLKNMGKMRFSEDIDFDYTTTGTFNAAKKELSGLMQELKNFDVERPRQLHETIRFDVYFTNPLNVRDRIMVEFRVKQKREWTTEKKVVDFGFVPASSPLMEVYKLEGLVYMKLNALYERMEGKDIYDLFYLLDLDFDIKEVNRRLRKNFRSELEERIKYGLRDYRTIQNSTNHYLPKPQRPDWRSFMLTLGDKIKTKF